MASFLQTKTGSSWYTDLDIQEVLAAVRDGQVIPIWWFAPWGQRFAERVLIAEDEVAFIRTESDDG